MGKLSTEALNAIELIREEYGDEVANELLYTKVTKPKINCDVINEHHIALLKKSYWVYNYGEFGAAGMYDKKPYGNGSVLADIREITGLPNSDTTLENLHRGLVGVLQVWVNNGCPALEDILGLPIGYEKINR